MHVSHNVNTDLLGPVAYGKKPQTFKNYYDTACDITNSVMFITNPQPAIVALGQHRKGCVDYSS